MKVRRGSADIIACVIGVTIFLVILIGGWVVLSDIQDKAHSDFIQIEEDLEEFALDLCNYISELVLERADESPTDSSSEIENYLLYSIDNLKYVRGDLVLDIQDDEAHYRDFMIHVLSGEEEITISITPFMLDGSYVAYDSFSVEAIIDIRERTIRMDTVDFETD